MLKAYPALFHAEDGGYWVEFPDLDGCFSQGESIAEASANASDALEGFLFSLMERGIEAPAASDICALSAASPDFTSIITIDTSALLKRTRAIKKTLTIPAWLNDAAESRGVNFSRVLQDALCEQLGLGT